MLSVPYLKQPVLLGEQGQRLFEVDTDSTLSYLQATSRYPDRSNTRIIGSCTGLLAAAAASSSRGLSELPDLGVTLVRIAFRVGVAVAGSRQRVQQGPTRQGSWSVAVAESSQDNMRELIEQFHADEVRVDYPCIQRTYSHSMNLEHLGIESNIY